MTDNIDVVVKESGTDQVIKSFDDVAAAAQRAHTSVSKLQKLFGNVGRSTAAANRVSALGTAAQGATGHVNNLASAMTSLNNTRVTSNLTRANTALGNTATQSRNAASGVRDLLAAFISFQAIRQTIGSLIEAQVAMQQIHFGLLAATGSAERAGEQFEYLRANADRLGLDLRTSAQEYTRLAASADAMNVAVEDQQKLYTSLSQASTVLHLDAQKVQFATLALTQMFSKGKIQAEELRRQLGEAIPGVVPRFQKGVMEVVKGTDLAKYSFEDLMKRGLLNTKQFLPQLVQALEETGRGWEEAAGGLNAEINRLKTAWFELKVEVTEGLFSEVLIRSVRFLSQNMKELTAAAIGFGVAISVALAPAAIVRFTGYVTALGKAIWLAAGPWGILAGAIIGVSAAVLSMRDDVLLSSDSLATLGDFLKVIWQDVAGIMEVVIGTVVEMGRIIQSLLNTAHPVFSGLTALVGAYGQTVSSTFDDISNSNDATWLKIVKMVARTVDAIAGLLVGLARAVVNVFAEIGKTIGSSMANSVMGIKALVSGDLDGAMEYAKKNQEVVTGVFERLGQAVGDGFNTGFELAANYGLEQYVNKVQDEAKRLAMFRNVKTGGGGGPPPPGGEDPTGGGGGKKGKPDKTLERLEDQLRNLIGQISPTEAALKKLAEAQEILNQVAAKGTPEMKALVEQMGGAANIMGLLREKYKDALDPVGALNDKYDQELRNLRAITPEQKANAAAQEVMTKARKDGYDAAMQAALGEAAYRRELEKTTAQLIASAEAEAYANSTRRQAAEAGAGIQGVVNQHAAGNISSAEMGVGVKAAVGIEPNIWEQYVVQQEQYAAHLEAMQALRVEYGELAAQTEGQQREAYMAAEQAVSDTILEMEIQKWTSKLQFAAGIAGQFTGLMQSQNKTAFKIGQAASIAQVAMATPTAAMEAFKSLQGIPYVGPVLGAAAAAAAIAYGAQQISQIRSQQPPQFRTGGSMVVGGSGGIDSQPVSFFATPGETVSINTPAEARAMQSLVRNLEEGGFGGGSFTQNVTIVQQGRQNSRTEDQVLRKLRKQTQRDYEEANG